MTFNDLKPRFDTLAAAQLGQATLESWLHAWDDLSVDIQEEGAWRFIRTACDTTDKAAAEALKEFQGEWMPKLLEAEQVLKVKLLDSGLQPEGLEHFVRGLKTDREIFRAENLPLQALQAATENEYTVIAGAQSVTFQGKERTMRQMAAYLEDPDRGLRERAWRAMTGRRLKDKEKLDALFERLLKQRFVIAGNAGFADYAKFRYKEYNRFDYSPSDALALHQRIFDAFGPLIALKNKWKAKQMGLKALRPWDAAYDVSGAEPLKPFKTAEELYQGVKRIYAKLDAEPAAMLERLWNNKWLDLDSRLGKGPGGFNYGLPKSKGSFIFWSSTGVQTDIMVLLHEGGHAYQGQLSEKLPYFFQRQFTMEYAELGSMSMELLAQRHLEEFYSPTDADRARLDALWDIPDSICRMASIDRFQHLLYATPTMSAEERNALWYELSQPLLGGFDLKGCEEVVATGWQPTLHIFRFPFYYLDYAFAQMGALQLWEKNLTDPEGAFADYKRGIALGATRSLPELYRAAGVDFIPSDGRLKSLAVRLESEMDRLLKRLKKPELSA